MNKIKNKMPLLLAASLLSAGLWGQSMNDIYNFQRASIQYGTPRFMGMSGAFGALGGEISAASINPAAGAVAVKTEASITAGVEWYGNEASYYGSPMKSDSKNNFTVFQGGANFVFMNDNPYTALASFNLGINYSRRNNFNNQYSFEGINNTITDWQPVLDDQQNVIGWHPIGSSVIESFFRQGQTSPNSPVVKLATDLGVLEKVGNNIYPSADYLDINQAATIATSGYMGVTTFSGGINLNNRIYLGLGFDYYSLNLGDNNISMDEWGYTENPSYLHGSASNLYYDRYTAQSGWGSAFTLGIIGRVTDAFRLGFSWKSAARINIDENYSYAMGVKFFDGVVNEGTENPTYYQPNSYSFKSPSEWTFSAAYVFGQHGTLSVDYMLKDFSKMRFRTSGFESQNAIIANQMQISNTVRVGAEARFFPVSIRAGFNYSSSPYKDITVKRVDQQMAGKEVFVTLPQGTGDTFGFSAGIGYSIKNFMTLDVAYVNSSFKTYSYLYEPELVNPAENKVSAHYVSFGATFRF